MISPSAYLNPYPQLTQQQSRQQRGAHDSRKNPIDNGNQRGVDSQLQQQQSHHHHQPPITNNVSNIPPLLDFSSMNDNRSSNGKSDRIKHTSHTGQ